MKRSEAMSTLAIWLAAGLIRFPSVVRKRKLWGQEGTIRPERIAWGRRNVLGG